MRPEGTRFGGLEINEAKRLRQLEEENLKLKRLVANLSLDNIALKDLLSKTGNARSQEDRRAAASGYAWLFPAAKGA